MLDQPQRILWNLDEQINLRFMMSPWEKNQIHTVSQSHTIYNCIGINQHVKLGLSGRPVQQFQDRGNYI